MHKRYFCRNDLRKNRQPGTLIFLHVSLVKPPQMNYAQKLIIARNPCLTFKMTCNSSATKTRVESPILRLKTHVRFSVFFLCRKSVDKHNNCPPPCPVDCVRGRDAVKGKFQFVNAHFSFPFHDRKAARKSRNRAAVIMVCPAHDRTGSEPILSYYIAHGGKPL